MDYLHDRVIALAQYIADTGATVRQAAAHFGISKSTVHKDMTTRLFYEAPSLYAAVRQTMRRGSPQLRICIQYSRKHAFVNLFLPRRSIFSLFPHFECVQSTFSSL